MSARMSRRVRGLFGAADSCTLTGVCAFRISSICVMETIYIRTARPAGLAVDALASFLGRFHHVPETEDWRVRDHGLTKGRTKEPLRAPPEQ